jgi:hypothetical protein
MAGSGGRTQAPEQTLSEHRESVLRGTPWIRPSALAATALEAMPAQPSDAQEALIADIHDSLRGGSQHSRYTQRRRLAALDRRLGEILAERGARQRIRIHDMAASNAITSLELFDHLRDREPVSVKASDYYDRLHVVNVGERWRVAFDVDRKPIQYIGRRMMICARRPDPDAPTVDTVVKPALQAALLPPALAALQRALEDPRAPPVQNDQYRQMSLFHPRCRSEAATNARFELQRDDLFSPAPFRYDVVRIANALSTDFMSEARIIAGVRAVAATIAEGGLLVLGRNAAGGDGPARGTIFVRDRGRLIPLADVSEGYQHKEAVRQLTLA